MKPFCDRAHAIDEEECRMMRVIERMAHTGDITCDTRRRLIVGDEHGLDLVMMVGLEVGGKDIYRHAFTPGHVDHLDLEAQTDAHIDPQMRELAEARGENLVAGRQRVGEGGFPATSAGGREEESLAGLRLEDLLHIFEQRQSELREVGRALVLHRDIHRPAHSVRHIGGSRNEQSANAWHGVLP
jgi:hypothetical protein